MFTKRYIAHEQGRATSRVSPAMAVWPLGYGPTRLAELQQLIDQQPDDVLSSLNDMNTTQYQSAIGQRRNGTGAFTLVDCLHGPGAMSAGLGGREGATFVSALTVVKDFSRNFVGIGWLKGSAWVLALTAQNSTDAESAPEHWRNTGDWLNGSAVVTGTDIKGVSLTVDRDFVAFSGSKTW